MCVSDITLFTISIAIILRTRMLLYLEQMQLKNEGKKKNIKLSIN